MTRRSAPALPAILVDPRHRVTLPRVTSPGSPPAAPAPGPATAVPAAAGPAPLGSWLRRHGPLLALLSLHQGLLLLILRRDPLVLADTWDCVVGAMAADTMKGFSFSVFDSWDGVIGGMELRAVLGLPLFAVFGVTPFAVRLAPVLLAAATGVLVYLVGCRIGGRLAGTLSAAAVLFPPPVGLIAQLAPGNYHSSEVFFEATALLWLLAALRAESEGRLRRPARFALLWGMWLGFSVFHCFATLIFLPALWLVAWACLRHRVRPGGLALHGLGLLLGSLPIWWKVAAHVPYGVAGAVRVAAPKEATSASFDPRELVEMIPGGGFAQALHFDTALGAWQGSPLASALAWLCTCVLFAGWLALALWTLPSIGRVLAGALPGRRADVSRLDLAVLPALMSAFFLLGFVLSDMRLERLPWYLSNPREHDHVGIVPWISWMAVGLGLLVAALVRAHRGTARLPGGRLRVHAATAAALLASAATAALVLAALGGALAVAAGPSPGSRGPYTRATCWDVPGFYMASYIGKDPAQVDAGCRRLGQDAWLECRRGAAWAVGYGAAGSALTREVGTWGPDDLVGDCRALGEPWTEECMRGVGWALRSGGGGDVAEDADMALLCDALDDPDERRACWLGVGFPIGDHLGSSPARLRRALDDLPADRRELIAEGAGALVGRGRRDAVAMRAICESWGADLAAACERGAAGGLAWRGGIPGETGPAPPSVLPGPFLCRLDSEPSPAVAGEPMSLRVQLTPRQDGPLPAGRLVLGMPPGMGDAAAAPPVRAELRSGRERVAMQGARSPGSGRWYHAADFGPLPAGRPLDVVVGGLLAPDRPLQAIDLVVRVAFAGESRYVDTCGPASLRVVAGPPAGIRAVAPSTIPAEGGLVVSVRSVDALGNESGTLPDTLRARVVPLAGGDAGPWNVLAEGTATGWIELPNPGPGHFRVEVEDPREGGLRAVAGPVRCLLPGESEILWMGIEGSTDLSSGLLPPGAAWAVARGAGLDAAALAEPGWQLDPRELALALAAADEADAEGRFAAVPSVEADGGLLLFADSGPLGEIAASGLGGSHDQAEVEDFGAPAASFAPDPALTGSPGGFPVEIVRPAPGSQPADSATRVPVGGLLAVVGAAHGRASILAALREGRSWVSTGSRALLDLAVDRAAAESSDRAQVRVRVCDVEPPVAIEVLRDGRLWRREEAPRNCAWEQWVDPDPPANGSYQLRALLSGGHVAWLERVVVAGAREGAAGRE